VFLDIQRHLQIGDLASQRTHQPDHDQDGEDGEHADAKLRDRLGTEFVGLESPRRQRDGDERACDDEDSTLQERPSSPSAANLPDDVDEFLATGCAVQHLSHWGPLTELRALRSA
jgi:hypothetical protein